MSLSTVTSISAHLEARLESLADLFQDERVTEISANPDGSVWVERLGDGAMVRHPGEFSEAEIDQLANDLAGTSGQPFSQKSPIVSAEFPYFGAQWRVQLVGPPVVEGRPSVSLRRIVLKNFDLETLIAGVKINASIAEQEVEMCQAWIHQEAWQDFFSHIIHARWNILISGGTGSGKTTWLRSLLQKAERTDRIVTIENAFEIRPTQPNHVSMRMSTKTDSRELLKAAMRMRPDRVLLGELRGSEARDFLAAINSGHPGGITTIHADSTDSALVKLANYVMEAGTTLTLSDVMASCRSYIDCILQLDRDKSDGSRHLSEIRILRGKEDRS